MQQSDSFYSNQEIVAINCAVTNYKATCTQGCPFGDCPLILINKLEKYLYGKQTVIPEKGPGGNPNAGSTPCDFLRSSNNALAFILLPIIA